MVCKKNLIGIVLLCFTFSTAFLFIRDAFIRDPGVQRFCWCMNGTLADTTGTKITFDTMKVFREKLSSAMKEELTKRTDNFQTNKTVGNKTIQEIYKIEREKKFKLLAIETKEIKFTHNLPMLIHFIWINNDVRTKNNYDKETEENIKTFSIYEKIGWKIIVWNNKNVHNIFCADNNNNKNKELCEILTNVTLTTQKKITLSMKSDMLRFFIIHEFGGMYFDTDFIALRNINHIIGEKIQQHGLILANEVYERRSMYLAGEFFAAYPGNICIENAKNHVIKAIKGNEPSHVRTGPYYFKKAIVSTYFDIFDIDSVSISKFNLSKIAAVLPTEYLYKFQWKQRKDLAFLDKVKKLPETYFIHLWRGSWLKH